MSKSTDNDPVPTTDTRAATVAETAYAVTRASFAAQGVRDLPTWSAVPGLKKTFLTNAARAALNRKTVWDVWAKSCGAEPGGATEEIWRDKPAALKVLPTVIVAVADAAIRLCDPETDTADERPEEPQVSGASLLDDSLGEESEEDE